MILPQLQQAVGNANINVGGNTNGGATFRFTLPLVKDKIGDEDET